jgi:hypothetical protein
MDKGILSENLDFEIAEIVKQTTIQCLRLTIGSRLELLLELGLEERLRDLIRAELQSLMRQTENTFVHAVGEAVVEAIGKKLAAPESSPVPPTPETK